MQLFHIIVTTAHKPDRDAILATLEIMAEDEELEAEFNVETQETEITDET